MPTVVLMDVSLSMTRPVSLDGSEEFQRKNLAVHGLNMLFEHMASSYRLEFTALMAFSSLWELLVPFTRDYNALQVKCYIHPLPSLCLTPEETSMTLEMTWILTYRCLFLSRRLWATWKTMIRPVLNQLFKELVMLYSRSGAVPAPVKYVESLYAISHLWIYYWLNKTGVWSHFHSDFSHLCPFIVSVMFMYLPPLSYRWCWLLMDLLVLERVPYVTPCKHWSSVGMTRSFHCLSPSLPKCSSCV